MVGYLLEYLVGFALVANSDMDAAQRSGGMTIIHLCTHITEIQLRFVSLITCVDLISFTSVQRIMYIVQVKFLKRITKQQTVNACDATDPASFYCKRNSNGEVLKGFKERRTDLLEEIDNLKYSGYKVQRMLFVHTGETLNPLFTQDVLVVTKDNHPDFFNMIGSGVWEFLDRAISNFS